MQTVDTKQDEELTRAQVMKDATKDLKHAEREAVIQAKEEERVHKQETRARKRTRKAEAKAAHGGRRTALGEATNARPAMPAVAPQPLVPPPGMFIPSPWNPMTQ
jgi:hypothetical protein